jgi:phosphoribosyl-ATP pyrophosphohydrolase
MNHKLEVLADLAAAIAARRGASTDDSYTARLLSQGVSRCAKKLGEEAVEAAIAAVEGNKVQLASEAADVLYHLLVLLEAGGVSLSDVMAELERRKGTNGIAEKAARKSR